MFFSSSVFLAPFHKASQEKQNPCRVWGCMNIEYENQTKQTWIRLHAEVCSTFFFVSLLLLQVSNIDYKKI